MSEGEDLAASVRVALEGAGALREVRMFGGIGFMLNGHLLAGASARGLLLRIGSARRAAALTQPGARPMVMRGREMADYVYVDPPALSVHSVNGWIQLALAYVRTLAPRAAVRRRAPRPASPRPGKSAKARPRKTRRRARATGRSN
jgi:TfoX/Sxy family transcriptional regulator of competence genes